MDRKHVDDFVRYWWNNDVVVSADIAFFLKDAFDIEFYNHGPYEHDFSVTRAPKRVKAHTKEEEVKRTSLKRMQRRARAFDKDTKRVQIMG